ncbi:MAG: immunoglobulin domain-containing protein, partial [Puniceicoccales bacterium]|nr:immunoglobulin domain-containing protein [Puniceicoccales bacterium]
AVAGATTLTVAVTGDPAPALQWQRKLVGSNTWENLDGKTATTLTLSSLTYADNGTQYRAVATNAVGTTISTTTTLIVAATAPSFTTNLGETTTATGGTVTLTVAVSGDPQPTLQWQVFVGLDDSGTEVWEDLDGETTDTLTLSGLTYADNGTRFRVVATNDGGTTASTPTTLEVAAIAPTFSTDLSAETTATNDGTVTLSVAVSGDPLPALQWQVSAGLDEQGTEIWEDLDGETTDTLTLSGLTYADNGTRFRIVATNPDGSVESSVTTLVGIPDNSDNNGDGDGNNNGGNNGGNNNDNNNGNTGNNNNGGNNNNTDNNNNDNEGVTVIAEPVITTDPADAYAHEGATVTFTVAATGVELTYEWLHNGTTIEGATTATLTLTQVLLDDAGSYQVRVTNISGSDISEPATLTVTGYDIYGLTTKGAKLVAPKFNKKANPLAKKTKQTFFWTVDYDDGYGPQPLTNKGKYVTNRNYTAKADGHYLAYYNYTPVGASEAVSVLAADFGWVQVFPKLKFHKTEGLFITERVTEVPSVKNGVVIADGEFIGLTAKLETAPETPVIYTWFDGKNVIRTSAPTFSQTDYLLYTGLTAKSKISVTVKTVATDGKKKPKPISLVKSKTLAIKVILPPVAAITTKVGDDGFVRIAAGKTLTLKTKVTGTAKFTYQWQYRVNVSGTYAEWVTLADSPKGTVENVVSGAAKATLSVKSATAAASGQYRVIVTNAAGLSYASTAVVAVAVQVQ